MRGKRWFWRKQKIGVISTKDDPQPIFAKVANTVSSTATYTPATERDVAVLASLNGSVNMVQSGEKENQILPKDVLVHLEKGDRTFEMLENGEHLVEARLPSELSRVLQNHNYSMSKIDTINMFNRLNQQAGFSQQQQAGFNQGGLI